jgi:hypothetical protein
VHSIFYPAGVMNTNDVYLFRRQTYYYALHSNPAISRAFGMQRYGVFVQDDEKFQVKADVPGIDKNDIKVHFDTTKICTHFLHNLTHCTSQLGSEADHRDAQQLSVASRGTYLLCIDIGIAQQCMTVK